MIYNDVVCKSTLLIYPVVYVYISTFQFLNCRIEWYMHPDVQQIKHYQKSTSISNSE